MAREAGVFWDARAKCWASSAIGEVRTTKSGKSYRTKVLNRDLADPKDKKRARAWLDGELERRDRKLAPIGRVSVEMVCQYYLEEAEKQLGPATYSNARAALNRALDWPSRDDPSAIWRLSAEDITIAQVQPFIAAMLEEGCSESYVTHLLVKYLKRMFSWASSVSPGEFPGLPLASHPLARLRGPGVPSRAFRDVKSIEVSRFIRWAWRRALGLRGRQGRFARVTAILMLTLRDTGARPKELCLAEWHELKQRPDGWGLLTLPWWKWKNGRKQKKDRRIAIPPHVMARLAWIRTLDGYHPTRIFTYLAGRNRKAGEGETADTGVPWVWYDPKTRRSGRSIAMQKMFVALAAKARADGIDLPEGFRSYWLRSAFSTNAQRRGVALGMLAESMGTSEKMLVRSYTDLDGDDIVAAARGSFGPARRD